MRKPHIHAVAQYAKSRRLIASGMSLFALFCLMVLASSAGAQTCIGPAPGVPPNYVPPHWWDNVPAQPVYYQSLDDPRWASSAAITFGDGASQPVIFRALHDSSNVYLSWRFHSIPASSPNNNILYLGLQLAGPGGGDAIVAINLATLTTTAADSGGTVEGHAINLLNGDGTLGLAPGAAQAWLASTMKVWINASDITSGTPVADPNSWAVQMQIPTSNLTVTASSFKMWFEVLAGTPAMPLINPATFPRGQIVTRPPASNTVFPLSTNWGQFRLSTGPSDPACASAGVSLDVYKIGSNNPDDSQILYKDNPPGPHPVNTLHARILNHSGQTINPGDITATFRIANWGSMPDWEDGVPKDVLWSKIQCMDDLGGNITDCGSNVPNGAQILDGNLATATNDNHFDWALSNTQLAPFKSGDRRADNCMLVELASTVSPGLTFVNNSVRRNMIFHQASTFSRSAEINIKGLTPIAPDGRDVYVWVEILNMRKPSNDPSSLGYIDTIVRKPPQALTSANLPMAAASSTKPVPIPDAQTLRQMAADGVITEAAMDAALPTYRVHVYHDTGKFLTIAGQSRPILRQQGAFGYRMVHQGQFYGWETQIVGEGFTLEKLGDNFYRIKKVPNNGSVRVTTTIKALEQPPNAQGKFAVFADIGAAIPNGTFSNVVNTGFSFNGGLEYIVNSHFSAEGILGVHHFPGKIAGDVTAVQFTGGGKAYLKNGPNRPFVRAGLGGYHFTAGTTNFGGYFGGGLLHEFNSHLGLDVAYTFHAVNTPGVATKFSTVQGGVRYAF